MLFIKPSYGQNKILINEFLIDPPPQTAEIFNSGTETADISGWIIDDSGGTTFYTIPQSSILSPNSCLVFSGDFNLNKTSPDTIRLFNSSQQLIDSFSYKSSSGSGIAYFRFPDNNNYWTTGSASLGFYNKTDASCLIVTTLTPTITITPTISNQAPTISNLTPTGTWLTETPMCPGQACLTPTITPQSYDNIYISEAMVYPESGNNEWIELFNNNSYSIALNNWYIDDIENGGSTPKSFSADISAKSYYIINLSSSMLNNDGDSVRLLDEDKNLKDSFEYSGGEQGKTFGRTSLDNDDFCQQEPSSGTINNSCINPIPTITPTCTGQVCLTPTAIIKISTTKLISSTKPVLVNQLINTKKLITPTITITPGEVLGASNIQSTDSRNNKSLINALLFISFSYSLLTMVSILIKSKIIKKYALES